MVSSRSVLFGGALLLALVLQCKAQDSVTVDLNEEVKKKGEGLAASSGNRVVGWSLDGEPPGKAKVTATAGPIQYHDARKPTTHPSVMYTQWIHNDSPEPTKSTITRKKTHSRTHVWRTERAFDAGVSLKVQTKFFFADINSEIRAGVTLSRQSSESVTETEEFSVMQEITVPPLSSVKVEWIVTDYVQDVPWSSEVTVRGWFRISFEKPRDGSKVWLWNVCDLGHRLLTTDCTGFRNGGGFAKFTAKGVFAGVKNTETHLKISKHDLKAYGGKPLSVEIVKLPRH